jgi:hypothetical protein
MRGKVTPALQANACGTLLGLLALCSVPWLFATAALGRRVPGTPRASVMVVVTILLAVVAIVQWGWRLFFV